MLQGWDKGREIEETGGKEREKRGPDAAASQLDCRSPRIVLDPSTMSPRICRRDFHMACRMDPRTRRSRRRWCRHLPRKVSGWLVKVAITNSGKLSSTNMANCRGICSLSSRSCTYKYTFPTSYTHSIWGSLCNRQRWRELMNMTETSFA